MAETRKTCAFEVATAAASIATASTAETTSTTSTAATHYHHSNMAAVPPAPLPLAPQVWHNSGNVAFTRGTKAYFGATIVSTSPPPTAGSQLPSSHTTHGTTGSRRGTTSLGTSAWTPAPTPRTCRCSRPLLTGQPQFRAAGTKLHFVAWTDPAAVMTSQIVCKEVVMLIASLRASWKAWCTKIPRSHPDHVRMSRLGKDLDQVRQTIRAFLFTRGPDPNSTQAFTTPALVFVALFYNTWMIVAIMDSNSRAPSHAEIVVDDTLQVF
ncbi:hypothetical protein HDU87_003595 [Geranomyces variabilis]|uniref:Uncharacterized protein n=1 Tax=Geranomyces variabilis TaxID=109894 RepID=A0AAD5TBV9_9FUNG|nr:hypothetical protein HDU87_003595 [Geranomyces variabilis]